MIRIAPCLILLLLLPLPARADLPEPKMRLDLPAAIAQALEHNLELARGALAVRDAFHGIAGAQSAFRIRWQPDARTATDQGGASQQIGLTASRRFLPGTELAVGGRWSGRDDDDDGETTRRTSFSVDLKQPLFRDFGALVQGESLTRAERQLLRARRDVERQKADLVVQTVETFEALIRLDQQIRSDEAAFLRIDKLYRLTKARERQGRASRVDTLRVELQRGQAQSRLEDSRERHAFTRREFAESLGLPLDMAFDLEPPPLLEIDLPPAADAVATALSNRLDYAQTLQDYDDTVRGVALAERALWPSLALVTRYERLWNDPSYDGQEEDLWTVGLAGDTELGRSAEKARLGQAHVQREAALETIRIRQRAIAREIQQQLSACARARSERLIAERNFTLAENRARLARRLFERGRGDNFSVTDAEEALNEAETRRLTARAEASVTGYQLLRSLGLLVEAPADLKPDALTARGE